MSQAKAKESILKAHELKHDNTRFYRELNDKIRDEIKQIRDDRYLSAEGRLHKESEVKERHGKELMKLAHTRRQEFISHLNEARKNAEAVIYAKIPKPDATKLERFEDAFRKLKTELMLSVSSKSAAAKLTQFIEGIDDPYLANRVSEEFSDLAGPIISLAEPGESGKLRMELSRQFDGLADKYEDPDARAARSTLETAEDMEKSQFFSDLVRGAVNETVGVRYGSFINSTDSYFEQNPEEKPSAVTPKSEPAKTSSLGGFTDEEKETWRKAMEWQKEYRASKAAEQQGGEGGSE